MLDVKKVFWADVSNHIKNINPIFYKLVDEISLGDKFAMYLVEYSYGDLVGDDIGIFLPTIKGGYVRLDSEYTSPSILDDLYYGFFNSPLGIFYNKSFEWFLSTSDEQINKTFPIYIDSPGTFFSITHITNFGHNVTHIPNNNLFVSAGSKSNFIIPKIGCGVMHSRIQKDFNITKSAPSSHHEHSVIFQDIIKSTIINNGWKASVLFFSKEWIEKINTDSAWLKVREYFYKTSSDRSEYNMNIDYYHHIYRTINKRNNLKTNLYIFETAQYIFEILFGAKLGFAPATTDELLPLSFIQKVYTECYKLEYSPIIAIPTYYNYLDPKPVYYSLQHPSLCSYSPKARNASTNITDLIALIDVIDKYQKDFSLPIRECKNTILEKISKITKFTFYHSAIKEKGGNIINSPEVILNQDERFHSKMKFPTNASFFKGCISISNNIL